MHGIQPDQERNAEPSRSCGLLCQQHLFRVDIVHRRPGAARADLRERQDLGTAHQIELADLLIQRHALQQRLDTPLDGTRLSSLAPAHRRGLEWLNGKGG